jgi:hypothetical protein
VSVPAIAGGASTSSSVRAFWRCAYGLCAALRLFFTATCAICSGRAPWRGAYSLASSAK